ncbi:MAG: DUF3147 family protein [Terriglobales bacterium]
MLVKFEADALRQTRWYEYASRFFFGGAITALAGLIAHKYGPAVGGLFLAFPAIFPASASLIEKHENERKARAGFTGTKRGRIAAGIDAAGATMGCIGLIVFAVFSWRMLPAFHTWLTLISATLAWAAVSVTVWITRKRT